MNTVRKLKLYLLAILKNKNNFNSVREPTK